MYGTDNGAGFYDLSSKEYGKYNFFSKPKAVTVDREVHITVSKSSMYLNYSLSKLVHFHICLGIKLQRGNALNIITSS